LDTCIVKVIILKFENNGHIQQDYYKILLNNYKYQSGSEKYVYFTYQHPRQKNCLIGMRIH